MSTDSLDGYVDHFAQVQKQKDHLIDDSGLAYHGLFEVIERTSNNKALRTDGVTVRIPRRGPCININHVPPVRSRPIWISIIPTIWSIGTY